VTSSKKVSSKAMLSSSGLNVCGPQTCFFVLVLAMGLDVNVKEREQGFSLSLLNCLPGLEVPAFVSCAKGCLCSGCRANQGWKLCGHCAECSLAAPRACGGAGCSCGVWGHHNVPCGTVGGWWQAGSSHCWCKAEGGLSDQHRVGHGQYTLTLN